MRSWRSLSILSLAWLCVFLWNTHACAPPDPCKSCKANELCQNGICVPLPPVEWQGDAGGGETASQERVTSREVSPDVSPKDTPDSSVKESSSTEYTTEKNSPEPVAKDGGTISDTTTGTPDVTNVDSPPIEQPPTEPEPQCRKDEDCASTHECKQGKCLRKPLPCKPACPAGSVCTNSICETPGATPGLGELCGPNTACKAGLFCLKTDDSQSYCVEPCQKSDDCAQNALGKFCLQLTTNQKYCADLVPQGAKCGFANKLQAICQSGSICSEGTCKKPIESKLYEQCGINAKVCPNTMLCLRFGGASFGYCVTPCTPGPNASCPQQGTCTTLSGGSGACLPKGTGKHDQACGGVQNGPTLDPGKICQPGLECVQLQKAICMEFWTGDCNTSGKTCPAGRTCQVLNGSNGQTFGACFQNCKSDGSCASAALTCRKQYNNTCWP